MRMSRIPNTKFDAQTARFMLKHPTEIDYYKESMYYISR